MPKDYAKKYSTPKENFQRNKRVTVLLALIILLLIGGFVSSAIYFEHHPEMNNKPHVLEKKAAQEKRPLEPTFDFYSILTDTKTQVPEEKKSSSSETVISGPGYVLQIAAVRNYADAEQLKAQLALLGFTVFIQKLQQNGVMWNRVNVGPYTSLVAAKADQMRLKRHQINSMLFTLKRKN